MRFSRLELHIAEGIFYEAFYLITVADFINEWWFICNLKPHQFNLQGALFSVRATSFVFAFIHYLKLFEKVSNRFITSIKRLFRFNFVWWKNTEIIVVFFQTKTSAFIVKTVCVFTPSKLVHVSILIRRKPTFFCFISVKPFFSDTFIKRTSTAWGRQNLPLNCEQKTICFFLTLHRIASLWTRASYKILKLYTELC